MNKLYQRLPLVLFIFLFSSCVKERGPFEHETVNDEELVLVNLNFSTELSVNETPLTRTISSDDLFGIQVKQGSTYYAYGLFDDPSNVSIYLHTGKQYSFECCLVKNGKSLVSVFSGGFNKATVGTQTWCINGDGYGLPFIRGPKGSSGYVTSSGNKWNFSASANARTITNKFVYSSSEYFLRLQYGQLNSMYSKGTVFYGKTENIIGGEDLSVPISLKCGSFGVSLSVVGITDGDVTVTIKNSNQVFHTNSNITQDTQFGVTRWTFYDLASAYQYADDYAENFTVGVVWNRGVGVTQDLGTKAVQFRRNVVNNVIINLSSTTGSSGLAVSLEEPELTSESFMFGN